MTGCIVFSGTTEGRILSDALSAHGIKHIVCVAGTYGEDMMEDDPARTVHVGRMDEGQMKEFFWFFADKTVFLSYIIEAVVS